eukprot:scaffold60711_cov65-Attheya_sp.AAC.15
MKSFTSQLFIRLVLISWVLFDIASYYNVSVDAFVLHLPSAKHTVLPSAQTGSTTTVVLFSKIVSDDDDNPSIINDDDVLLFRRIFTNDIPLLDVRAGVEFAKGAFPTSVNMPILNDEQRHLVGICYKENGSKAAYELGVELVTPVQEQLINAWKKHAEANPTGYLYCFRGGSRSAISQKGLRQMAGVEYPRVAGGYKAMRQFLLNELEQVQDLPIVMIGGRTASGKTHLLKHFTQFVDLEGLANHRGSAFGALVDPQPTQINFENDVAIAFLKLQQQQSSSSSLTDSDSGSGQHAIFIEEEGRRIGRLTLPLSMYRSMVDHYPCVELITPWEDRVRVCMKDYVTDMFPLFESSYGDLAHEKFRNAHLNSLDRIKKRLPDHDVIRQQVTEALDLFEQNDGDDSGFHQPIEQMLHFYDKMYDYQSSQRNGTVLFRGDSKAIIDWAESKEGRRTLAAL